MPEPLLAMATTAAGSSPGAAGVTSPSRIPLPKSRIPVVSPTAAAQQQQQVPPPPSRIPKAISPDRTLPTQQQQHPKRRSSGPGPEEGPCGGIPGGPATFVRRLSPPFSPGAAAATRNDRASSQEPAAAVDIDAELAARVRQQQQQHQRPSKLQQQHQARRGSDPLAKSRSASIGALSTSPTRKTSAPVTSPSRIPIASDYLPSSDGSGSRSNSHSAASTPSRTSPVRQASPPRKVPAMSSSPRRHSASKSTDHLADGEDDRDLDEAEATPVCSPSKASAPDLSSSGGSRIPLPKSASGGVGTRGSPPKQQQMPTFGWSFSPERMLRTASAEDGGDGSRQRQSSREDAENSSGSDQDKNGDVDSSASGGEDKRKKGSRKYEAFVMTGDRMIQLAKTPANSEFKSKYSKAVSDTCILGHQQQLQEQAGERLEKSAEEESREVENGGGAGKKRGALFGGGSSSRSEDEILDEEEVNDSTLGNTSGVEPLPLVMATSTESGKRMLVSSIHSAASPDTETNMSENFNVDSVLGGASKISPNQSSSSPDTPEWSLLDSFHKKNGSQQQQQQLRSNGLADAYLEVNNSSRTPVISPAREEGNSMLAEARGTEEGGGVLSPGAFSNRTLTPAREDEVDGRGEEEEEEAEDSLATPVATSVPPFGMTFTKRSSKTAAVASAAESPPPSIAVAAVAGMPSSPPHSNHSLSSNVSSGEEESLSDMESLHSYRPPPPARTVDIPSAVRLAKRLYHLDGFRTTDVSRHLSRNTDYNHVVAEEYLKFFDLSGIPLDEALRRFLGHFCLTGETQERERVLLHFARRYLECNPGESGVHQYRSPDAVHTLTCAIMLLNTDLHGEALQPQRRMTCSEFVENLSELNDGGDFPRELLKRVYASIKARPIPWAAGDDLLASTVPPSSSSSAAAAQQQQFDSTQNVQASNSSTSGEIALGQLQGGINPFLSLPDVAQAREFKSGYVMRKSCLDADGKRTKLGRRGWKVFFVTLRDAVLYCFRDEKTARQPGAFADASSAVRAHHSLAERAADYVKKQHVFRLRTADRAEYLFQASDEKELLTWIETLNRVAAAFSAPQLAAACEGGGGGGAKSFKRPLLPSGKTRLNPEEQLESHERQLEELQRELSATEVSVREAEQAASSTSSLNGGGTLLRPRRGSSWRLAAEAAAAGREKAEFLRGEIVRYETYVLALRTANGGGGALDI